MTLLDVLARSRSLGFLGPGPVEGQLAHAQGFVDVLASVEGRVVDLGSGGGVPGLVLAVARPDLEVLLVDASAKRCRFLEEAVGTLRVSARVIEGRAEVVGRGELRGTAHAVMARSFARPAPTAECAAPLLRVGGLLVVSEPPEDEGRWPAGPLEALGLVPRSRTTTTPSLQILQQVEPCPEAYPRRDGVPSKRPLF
jgi:16S rRNA (guanine527-N7)-methyltransferase